MVQRITKHFFISKCQKHTFGIFPFLIFFFLLFAPLLGNGQSQLTPVILESTELTISGNTNVNSFTCKLVKSNLNDTLKYVSNLTDETKLFNGLVFKFNVSDFVCDHNVMTKDFKVLLKENDFPYIIMNINEVVVQKTSNQAESHPLDAHIILYIAGQSKREYIESARIEQSDKLLDLTGSHKVLMSDFEITPPTKLFGTVRTEDAIKILFSIKIK